MRRAGVRRLAVGPPTPLRRRPRPSLAGPLKGARPDESHVQDMTQRDGVLALEVFELRRIRVVRRLAVRDRERGLPDPRVEPERMLEPRGSALAEEARALLAIALELGPADAGVL